MERLKTSSVDVQNTSKTFLSFLVIAEKICIGSFDMRMKGNIMSGTG